jgi:hypothetical protein
MVSTKSLAAVGALAWLITVAFAKKRASTRHRDARLQRQQMTIWEGEGGNLPPPPSSHTEVPLH